MRIVVTGAAGSLGTHLVHALKDLQHDVVEWDNRLHPAMDVTEPFTVEADVLYHLAADKHAPDGEVHPYDTQRVNIEGTWNAIQSGAGRVILASTCKAADPETVYGASKLVAERIVLNHGGVVARLYNVEESDRNVFQIWREQAESGVIDAMWCYRYFITLDAAIEFLVAMLHVEPGRYAPDSGESRFIPDVARDWAAEHGDPLVRLVDRRKGDRLKEPLCASNEQLFRHGSFFQVVNTHDRELISV